MAKYEPSHKRAITISDCKVVKDINWRQPGESYKDYVKRSRALANKAGGYPEHYCGGLYGETIDMNRNKKRGNNYGQ